MSTSAPASATTAAHAAPAGDTVRVWDPFVRLFHWSLVAGFVAALATGDDLTRIHIAIGYGIGVMVLARVLWGFVGSRHARFADFVRGPRAALTYLVDALAFRAPRHLGHNPAGGLMVVALLVMVALTVASGWAMTLDAFWGDETLEGIHEVLAWSTVGFVALHVAGVVLASVEHGENLVRAMVTGRKRAL